MNQSVQGNFNRGHLIARIAAALLGGYVFTWGFVSIGVVGLTASGVDFHDAETAVLMLAFLIFLFGFLWAFAARSVVRVWAVLAGGGGAMTFAAWAAQQVMLS